MLVVARCVRELNERGFSPPFHPTVRVHQLTGLELWSISFADGRRAVFGVAAPVIDGQVQVHRRPRRLRAVVPHAIEARHRNRAR